MVHVLSDTAQMGIVELGDQRYPHAPTRFRRNALRLIQDPGGGRMVNLPEGEETRSPRVGTIGRPGAPHTSYPEPGACALRSSSRRRRLADAPLGRANRSSGFHPQAAWPGRKVRRCECYGSDRVADRPSALRAEAPRRRGWGTRLAPTARTGEILSRIDERLSPCLHRRPPRSFRPNPSHRRDQDARSQPFPARRVEAIYPPHRIAQVPMFLRVSSP